MRIYRAEVGTAKGKRDVAVAVGDGERGDVGRSCRRRFTCIEVW